jgi:hypothetical protein
MDEFFKGLFHGGGGPIFLKTSAPHSLMMTYRKSVFNADGGAKGIRTLV